ncbi:MAG: hypothetical protein AB1898_07220 [Acidobacteriota bacterium]
MPNDSSLRRLLEQLNQQYQISPEFKKRVSDLIDRIDGFSLHPDQVAVLESKLRETYERQVLVETCRSESQKSLERIRDKVQDYSDTLTDINHKLNQAENALGNLLSFQTQPDPAAPRPADNVRAKALAAFASINSKNSRIN